MTRLFCIAAMISLMSAAASATDLGPFNIDASANGIKVQNAVFSAVALKLSLDSAKELLVLEGTADSPAVLTQSRHGKADTISARKIKVSLKDGGMRCEGILLLKSVGPL